MIEAVVAMVVIGMASIPISMLISQSLDQLSRVVEANARANAIESALAVIDPMNPMDTPSGEIEMGDISMLWESTVLVPPNPSVQIGASLAGQSIGFYNVDINMVKNNRPWFSFSLRKVGFRKFEVDLKLLGING